MEEQRDRGRFVQQALPALLLAVGMFLLCAFTLPRIEAGLNDDWCYAFIAKKYAETGHLTFAGCAAPSLGIQLWLSALVVRWFGFSFRALRVLAAAQAAGCAVFEYLLMLQAGVRRGAAVFGTLAVLLSPVLFPNAVMFMTDVPALFFGLLALWIAMYSFQAKRQASAIAILFFSFLFAMCAASVRQFLFLLPITLFGMVAIIRRRERVVAMASSVLAVISLAALAVAVYWLSTVPGNVQSLSGSISAIAHPAGYARACVWVGLTVAMYLLPITAACLSRYSLKNSVFVSALLLAVVTGVWMPLPLLGNMMTPYGFIFQHQTLLGERPLILGATSRFMLTVATLVAAAAAAQAFFARLRQSSLDRGAAILTACAGPFLVAVFLAIVSRYRAGLFDRYLVPLLAVLAVVLLSFRPGRIPIASWALVLLLFGFEWAALHDYIIEWSARNAAVADLTATGVDRTLIAAGMESDGWAQLEATGALMDYHSRPASDFREGGYYLGGMTAIRPQYYITRSPIKGLVPCRPSVCFRQLLPPFRGCVFAARSTS